jgi:hypothetical protein
MRRELFACRDEIDVRVWSDRWAEQLSGRAAQAKIDAMKPERHAGPNRAAAGGPHFG